MKRTRSGPRSLKTGLSVTILICWLLPIVIVVTLAGALLNASYERSVQQELAAEAENALEQAAMRLGAAFEASKAVSYDGVVRNAYRKFRQDGDSAEFYRTVTDNLSQRFSREETVTAVFISFWEDVGLHPYIAGQQNRRLSVLTHYRSSAEEPILLAMREVDTDILLFENDGELYLCRNLLDSTFEPYASVVMQCDASALFRSLDAVRRLGETHVVIDERILLRPDGALEALSGDGAPEEGGERFSADMEGHSLVLSVKVGGYDIWSAMPSLRAAVLAVVLLVVPLLAVMLFLFRRLVTDPVQELVDATTRVQGGERGYVIDETPRSLEFQQLYGHFNTMSTELKNQFERSYQEQQALQQAKVKALQSQINPHFLNNTLEIIGWEARMAEDTRVSAMIEALSTMLDATLDRDGRGQIPLREEMSYVEAYLYIIKERLGDRLTVEKDISEALLDALVPRLILQPIVENAVEHDIATRRGGRLSIRGRRTNGNVELEVEHDGALTPEDKESVEQIVSMPVDREHIDTRVGLRNVRERLWLLYGDDGRLTVEETNRGTVLASVSFPV